MHPKELPIPVAAASDTKAFELLRVWVAQGNQHVSLATSVWKDAAAWGIMLVDLAKHVARSYEQTTGKPFVDVLKRIKEGFDAEWDTATDEPIGA